MLHAWGGPNPNERVGGICQFSVSHNHPVFSRSSVRREKREKEESGGGGRAEVCGATDVPGIVVAVSRTRRRLLLSRLHLFVSRILCRLTTLWDQKSVLPAKEKSGHGVGGTRLTRHVGSIQRLV